MEIQCIVLIDKKILYKQEKREFLEVIANLFSATWVCLWVLGCFLLLRAPSALCEHQPLTSLDMELTPVEYSPSANYLKCFTVYFHIYCLDLGWILHVCR